MVFTLFKLFTQELVIYWVFPTTRFFFFFFFKSSTFVGSAWSFGFFHPRHNSQLPPTSKDFLSRISSITFIFPILILERLQGSTSKHLLFKYVFGHKVFIYARFFYYINIYCRKFNAEFKLLFHAYHTV